MEFRRHRTGIQHMTSPITILAAIKLAPGKTESDLLSASAIFQADFVNQQEGILRRELVRTGKGEYLDIIQFRSEEDAHAVMEREKESQACHAFMSIMDFDPQTQNPEEGVTICASLATYTS